VLLGCDSQALAFDFQSSRCTMVESHIGKSHHRETLLQEESWRCDLKNRRNHQDDQILLLGE
jgi:hypothetical protein